MPQGWILAATPFGLVPKGLVPNNDAPLSDSRCYSVCRARTEKVTPRRGGRAVRAITHNRLVSTWLVALAGGAIGSLVTAILAVGARLLAAGSEIDGTDRFVQDRDEDLASWVADRSLALERDLAERTEELNKENLFYSGAHGVALARLKERALHEYRDQERQAQRDAALARERETLMHRFWRWRRDQPFPTLTAPGRAQPLLDAWRSSVTRHGDSPIEVVDPTRRALNDAIQDTSINPEKFV